MISAAEQSSRVTATIETSPILQPHYELLIKLFGKPKVQIVDQKYPGQSAHSEVFIEEKLAWPRNSSAFNFLHVSD